jgi:hypothetical protein
MHRHVRLAASLIAAASCGGPSSDATHAAAQSTATVPASTSMTPVDDTGPIQLSMRLAHGAGNTWRITYRFSRPVIAATFDRQNPQLGRAAWRVASPLGLTIERVGARTEVLRRADGKPFDEVVIEAPTLSEPQEKDYTPFVSYTDASTLVFTGQFHLTPLRCPAAAFCNVEEMAEVALAPNPEWTFAPRAGERVLFLGKVHEGEARWTSDDQGTYVYFGTSTPVVTDDMVGVVDAGTPAWLRDRVTVLLPKLFTFYRARTGLALRDRPIVFLSYETPTSTTAFSYGGGTLPGLVQIHFKPAAGTREGDPALLERVDYLIAHEAAHLWNAQRIASRASTGDWLHEGGADAFALWALRDLGFLSRDRFRALVSDNFSMCWLGLGNGAVKDLSRPGKTKGHYYCGSTIALWTEAVVRRASPKEDLFSFWQRLFAAAKEDHVDDAAYFAVLGQYAGGAEAADAMRRLTEGPATDAEAEATRALAALGISAQNGSAEAGSPYARWAAYQALAFATEGDCGAPIPITSTSTGFVAMDAFGCKHLAPRATFTHLAGVELKADGPRAYDAFVKACARGGSVVLSDVTTNTSHALTCPAAVRPRSPYKRLGVR